MLKKMKAFYTTCATAALTVILTLPAKAETSVVTPITPDTLTSKLKDLVINVGTPLGAVVLIACFIVVAIKFMGSGGNDRKKAEAIESLYSVAIGGIILGGILFLAGAIMGIGQQLK